MKKAVIVLIMLLLCGCTLKKEKEFPNEIIKKHESLNNDSIPKYVDENPVKVSLYVDNSFGGLDKVKDEFHEPWRLKRDIAVFGAVFSEEDVIASDYFQNIWNNSAKKYENFEKYKIGWYINFTLEDGTEYERTILNPKDVEDFYDYLEIYLYDSANVPIGVWYSHLLESDINEKTVITSMKLTAGSKYTSINSPIVVKTFTYDDINDFDEKGFYRGNSQYLIKVYND